MGLTKLFGLMNEGNMTLEDVLYSHTSENVKWLYESGEFYKHKLRERHEYEVDFFLEQAIQYLFDGVKPNDEKRAEALWTVINIFLSSARAPLTYTHRQRLANLISDVKLPSWKKRNYGMLMGEVIKPELIETDSKPVPNNKKSDAVYLVFHQDTSFPLTVLSDVDFVAIRIMMDALIISHTWKESEAYPKTLEEIANFAISLENDRVQNTDDQTYISTIHACRIFRLPTSENTLIRLDPNLRNRIDESKGLEYYKLAKVSESEVFHTFMSDYQFK